LKCGKCGADVPDGKKFCADCGANIEEEYKNIPKSEEKPHEPIKSEPVKQHVPTEPVIKQKSKKGIGLLPLAFIAIIAILILSVVAFSVPAFSVSKDRQEPTQVPYQETIQVPTQVPYQAAVQAQVDLQYSKSASWGSGGLLDFYLYETVTITNLDTVGGSFTAYAYFYDGGVQKTTQSQSQYLSPGQTVEIQLKDLSFTYTSSWQSRYSAKYDVTPPKKTVTTYETQYNTQMQSQVVTNYRTDYVTVTDTKQVTLLQYLTGSY
jgi:hypothetical protein